MASKKKTKSLLGYQNETKKDLEILIGDLYYQPKNNSQKEFLELIDNKEIIICSGPAGVGKSMISILKALELLKNPNTDFYQIILCTPAVEADEKLGYLKGSLEEKMEPYIYSSVYLFEKAIGKSRVQSLIEREYIKVIPLAFMRGINIDNAIVIAEEFQNATPRQVKTLLTRIGYNSKFIISGDLEQSDRYKDIKETGLYDALTRLSDIDEIGVYKFSENDIVRNKVISKILDKYK
jgi:phosphate starvation-inducible PhoH-like protein